MYIIININVDIMALSNELGERLAVKSFDGHAHSLDHDRIASPSFSGSAQIRFQITFRIISIHTK